MKNNQFARLRADHQTVMNELTRIRFLDSAVKEAPNAAMAYRLLLRKAFTTSQSESTFAAKLTNYLAQPSLNLRDYLSSTHPITAEIYYLVALQLLDFLPEVDFQIDKPIEAMASIQLPMIETENSSWDVADLLDAWYLLLTTHTKNGQTYLDKLTNDGYFLPFYSLPFTEKPLFFNGKAQAVFDTAQLIREVVYVESSVDSDNDGKRDLLKVELIRPAETNEGLKIPVLFTASPYNQGINDEAGEKAMHNVNVPLTEKAPSYWSPSSGTPSASKTIPLPRSVAGETREASETFSRERSYTLNDYFLARGFAAVYSAGIGTLDSDGIQTCGDPQQTDATVAVIEWLTGKRHAFTNKTDKIAISAWWCNGSVAMTGRSYLGTLATAAATTGVPGLKTIISEAAISSWYDYYRENGLMVAPGGFPGEDADVLAIETFSRMKAAADYQRLKPFFDQKMQEMNAAMARESGDYNAFWDARNYRKAIKNIQCDVVMVHGLNDWNVKSGQVGALWQGLRELPVNKKLILHQGQHIYINAFRSLDFTDMMNLWLSHKLYNVANGAPHVLPDVIVQDNVLPETWTAYPDWADPLRPRTTFYFAPKQLVRERSAEPGIYSFKDQLPQTDFSRYAAAPECWQTDLLNDELNPLSENRLLLKSAPFAEDRYIDGKVSVHIKIASTQVFGMLSVQLVDYGAAKRLQAKPTVIQSLPLGYDWREDKLNEFMLSHQETLYKMITKGHINLQNRETPWQTDALIPGDFYELTLDLHPTFYHLPAGHQLGVILYATDFGMTVRGNQEVHYSIDFAASRLDVPLDNGLARLGNYCEAE
ncbi:MAG: Xaa-Pro dipeptidyl-peptidase [Sporolactobacillus sp.]